MKKKSIKKRHFTVGGILLLIFLFILSLLILNMNKPTDIKTHAEENECDKCINEPSCCAEVRNTKDATSCEWPIRGYCNPGTCGQVEGKGQRCGWYWIWHNANDNDYKLGTNSPNGYGCMIGYSESSMKPRCTAAGPITLGPSVNPTPVYVSPTTTIKPIPTTQPSSPAPTKFTPTKSQPKPSIPLIVPTREPIQKPMTFITPETEITNAPKQTSIEFPKIKLPQMRISLPQINIYARKPLLFFEYFFKKIKYYDSKLEESINNKLRQLYTK